MSLNPGTRIGPYEVVELTGSGGMGQVYRARDTRLNRDVALKILPERVMHDSDPLTRFRREAQLLAALNHPNIATLHGIEETDVQTALVMEFVDGRTLAALIAEARRTAAGGLDLAEALAIARQIADALEAAHEHGIIHRDLKPANVIVRTDGTVKVLDFGLAKAFEPAIVPSDVVPDTAQANSPTVMSPAVTHRGVILGTAAYMSPEQARGKPVDKRADIWAFGVVLYEMVTGRRLFAGEHVTDVLAAVVKDTPDLTAAPVAVRRLLEKCLEKDPRKRLRDISGVSLLLEDAEQPPATPVTSHDARRANRTARLVGTAIVAVAGVGIALMLARRGDVEPNSIEFSIEAPPGNVLSNIYSGAAVSPDGQHVVFSAGPPASPGPTGKPAALWLRQLGSLEARILPGTEGGTAPVWSPDSRSIAFMAEKKLKRVEIAGGPPVTLADVPRADPNHPGAWSRDGVILFGCPCGLDRVAATGGTVTTLRAVDKTIKETFYGAPQFLPDGNRFLYFVGAEDRKVQGVYASSLTDPKTRTLILNTSAKAVYVPPRAPYSGYLLWMENQTLQARRFNADSLQLEGDPISIAEGVALTGDASVRAAYWTSDAGVLLYAPYVDPPDAKLPLAWIGRDGKPLGDAAPEGPYNAIALAKDDQRVAVTRRGLPRTSEPNGDIWLWDFGRHVTTRITFGAKTDENPVWSPDGQQIAFASDRDGRYFQLYRKNSSGAGDEERLTNLEKHQDPLDWSPDGRYLVYREMNRGTGWDLMLLPLEGDRKPITLLQTPESDSDARFSPDGRWLAFHSRLNGSTLEVYVQAFSGTGTVGLTGPRVQVSNGMGGAPLWRRDGRELYYQTVGTGKIMAAGIQLSPRLQAERPRELFSADISTERLHPIAVTSDGGKFLAVLNARTKPQAPRLNVMTNWRARLFR